MVRYKKKKFKWKKFLFSLLISTVLFLPFVFIFKNSINNLWGNIKLSTDNFLTSAHNSYKSYIQNIDIVEKQNQIILKLKEKLKSSHDENILLQNALLKTRKLEELLKLKKTKFPKSIPAEIIMRSPDSWHKQITINKGSKDNIKKGMVAVSPNGIIGQVYVVEDNYSIVKLIHSNQVRFGAQIKRNSLMGIIYSTGQPEYAKLKFIPIGSDIKIGDEVFTSNIKLNNLKQLYPPSYPVGKIIKVVNDKSNSQLDITVKLYENNSSLNHLLVIK